MRFWQTRKVEAPARVGIVVSSFLSDDRRRFDSLNCLLWSFKAQTHQDWVAAVSHDGPMPTAYRPALMSIDRRICVRDTALPEGQSGHPLRRPVALSLTADYILFTNDDNYYMPVFLEALLHAIQSQKADIAYCDMVHSHHGWQQFTTAPKVGRMDVGSFIAAKRLVEENPWTDFGFRGDGVYFEKLAKGAKAVKVPHCLFVHN